MFTKQMDGFLGPYNLPYPLKEIYFVLTVTKSLGIGRPSVCTLFATSLTFIGTVSCKFNSLYLLLLGLVSDRQSNTSVSPSIEVIPRDDRGMEMKPTAKSPVNRALFDDV
jgi:hypothetical protein